MKVVKTPADPDIREPLTGRSPPFSGCGLLEGWATTSLA